MKHTTRRVRLVAAVAAAAMIAAACGGEEAADDTPPADDAPAEEPADEEADEPEADDGAADDSAAVADFYSGNTLTMVVGYSAGGGYDTYARVIAAHLDRHIPGEPTIIVENMPGAGSMLSANNLANTLASDGSYIGHFGGGNLLGAILGNPAAQFAATDFNYIGAAVADTTTCVVRTDAGVDSLEDLRDRAEPLVFGGTAPGTNTDDVPNTLRDFFGLNIQVVTGYGGTSDIRVALEQGEVDAGCWAWESQRVVLAEELESGLVKPFVQAVAPHPDNPDVPLFMDLATTPEEEAIINAAVDGPALFARPFAMHPDTPAEIVAAMRQAFADTMADEQFLAAAADANLTIAPITGEELEAAISSLAGSIPDDLRGPLADVLVPQG